VGLLLAISEKETETRKIIERPKAERAKKKKTADNKMK
jgi:hypothetical protein